MQSPPTPSGTDPCVYFFNAFATQEIGCFSDSARKRPLTLAEAPACEEGKGAMSYEICASYCATKKGAAYFGVEYAFEVKSD